MRLYLRHELSRILMECERHRSRHQRDARDVQCDYTSLRCDVVGCEYGLTDVSVFQAGLVTRIAIRKKPGEAARRRLRSRWGIGW